MEVINESPSTYESKEFSSYDQIVSIHKKFDLLTSDKGELLPLYSVYAEIEGEKDVLLFKCFDEKEYKSYIDSLIEKIK